MGDSMRARITALLGAASMLLVSCHDSIRGQSWVRPWDCWRGENGYYSCKESDDKGSQLTWSEWESTNDRRFAIAYECVTQDFDPEYDPYDFLCKPRFSKKAIKFDDDTAPRLHCLGTNDDTDSDKVSFHCEPYWELKDEVRRKRGSGWFMWLALQVDGYEREALLEEAQSREKQFGLEIQRELDSAINSTVRKKSKSDLEAERSENDREAAEVLKMLNESESRDKARAARSREEIRNEIQSEIKSWQSGH
jgi:hypothetical protein